VTKKTNQTDPHLEREKGKYADPIPSREWIMAYLEKVGRLVSKRHLIKHFSLDSTDGREALRRRLRAMLRDGQLIQNRRGQFGLVSQMPLFKGIVVGRRDGYGMVRMAEGQDDIYLTPRQMSALFPGDEVMVRPNERQSRGRNLGDVVEVLTRSTQCVVGTYLDNKGVGVVVPIDPTISQEVLIPDEHKAKARAGDYVEVAIVAQPHARQQPIGHIQAVLGNDQTPGIEAEVMLRAHEIPHHWSETIAMRMRHLNHEIPDDVRRCREDLTALPLVTIDGEDAKDFDDAVYCEAMDKKWRLVVAIADVSYFIEEGSELDQEAARRGNSTYFPHRVIPMLPEALSNDLCSLKPQVERLAMVCDMHIDRKGHLLDYTFKEAIIRSHARLTYTQVAQMLSGDLPTQQSLVKPLADLVSLYKVLFAGREQRGALDFDSTESRMVMNSDHAVVDIVPVERTIAHRLIEECMLVANVASAQFLHGHRYPALYRIHEGPDPQKLIDLRAFLQAFGLSLGGRGAPKPKDYAKLLSQVAQKPEAGMLQTVILRSMKQAVYSPDNQGHFGLAYDEYLHFTSPIRRYPDLLVHRAIKAVLAKCKPTDDLIAQGLVLGEQCSITERRSDLAVRECTNWLKCRYMAGHLGLEFDGVISSVTAFGLFIAVEPTGIEGLIHISQLKNDYYDFDPIHHLLRGGRSGQCYQLGDRVKVRLVRVSVEDRQIDFELLDGGVKRRKRRR
jgi:ribonuclease R